MPSQPPDGSFLRSHLSDEEFRPLRAWLEYAGLWAIAIAYPLFHGIASGPEALTIEGAGRLDVLVLVLVVALLPPTIVTGIEFVITAVRPGAGIRFRAVALGVLAGIVVWRTLLQLDAPGLIRMVVPVISGVLFALARLRMELVRNFTEILAIALPVVIVQFCLAGPVRAEVFPHDSPGQTARIESGTPVVMIVLDEFSLPVIERSPGRINDELFPGFAGLARESTWYPNTRAVSDMTPVAVPAIMTGESPEYDDPIVPPSMSEYPDNLCSELASGGYEVTAIEPVTNLCGPTRPLVTRLTRMAVRGSTNPIVPGRLVHKAAIHLMNWTGSDYGDDEDNRAQGADDFIAGLKAGSHRFDLMHSILPHSPWEYMPAGERYDAEPDPYVIWGESQAMVDAEMQRMMAQLQYVDRQLAGWIEQLKSKGIWQKALVVITADHGVNFRAGENGRILNEENAGPVLSVPLFVKFPGQTKGRIDTRPASSLDIAPTIDAVIDADPPNTRDGRSLLADRAPDPADRVDVVGFYGTVRLSRRTIDRQRRALIKQSDRLFGSGNIFAVGGHHELLGWRVTDTPGLRPLAATLGTPDAWDHVDTSTRKLPVLVEATIPAGSAAGELPDDKTPPVAIAVNGRVVTTNRTWELEPGSRTLRVIIPAGSLRNGKNQVRIYAIGS